MSRSKKIISNKPLTEVHDETFLEDLPDQINLTIDLTSEMASAIIQPCLAAMAETAISCVEIKDGRLFFGVTFAPGLADFLYDLEAVVADSIIEKFEFSELTELLLVLERITSACRAERDEELRRRQTT